MNKRIISNLLILFFNQRWTCQKAKKKQPVRVRRGLL